MSYGYPGGYPGANYYNGPIPQGFGGYYGGYYGGYPSNGQSQYLTQNARQRTATEVVSQATEATGAISGNTAPVIINLQTTSDSQGQTQAQLQQQAQQQQQQGGGGWCQPQYRWEKRCKRLTYYVQVPCLPACESRCERRCERRC